MPMVPELIAGAWRPPPPGSPCFQAVNPAHGRVLSPRYPIASRETLAEMVTAAVSASRQMRRVSAEQRAVFLERYADALEAQADDLATLAASETGLAVSPRLRDVELPRTTGQLRLAAQAARDGSWRQVTIDTRHNVRSQLEPLDKPVLVIGPNNFPFAFNAVSGGDFASAIASGHAVVAKAHPGHPGTTHRLAQIAHATLLATDLPPATLQCFFQCRPEEGLALAGDSRWGALAFTGSRTVGLKLKTVAEAAGVPAYLEMGGLNPVVLLPHALAERPAALAGELSASCLLGQGQFCTKPGLVLLIDDRAGREFIATLCDHFTRATPGPLLSATQSPRLATEASAMVARGGRLHVGGHGAGPGFRHQATLLEISAAQFLADPACFQTEMFGPTTLLVTALDATELVGVIKHLDASLTGSIYSDLAGRDEQLAIMVSAELQPRIGRLLNDKMPTGVAVSPAMMHGGPYPAAGHPGFTAVGWPAAMRRFGALRCYDHVRPHRLPPELADRNPTGRLWRCIDDEWTRADVPPATASL